MMYLLDAGRVTLFSIFLVATLRFFYLAWQTRNAHSDDAVVQQHFLEHAIASSFAFIGSLLGVLYSLVHLFSIEQGVMSEMPFTVSLFFLLVSGIAFMVHMIKEQNPSHPFYVRENGLDEAALKAKVEELESMSNV